MEASTEITAFQPVLQSHCWSQESETFSATRSIAWRSEKSAKIRGIFHEESRSYKLKLVIMDLMGTLW